MTTDNRTNEPNQNETKSDQTFCFTEAQVEAAAKALREDILLCHMDESAVPFEKLARAALVAAAGTAPQAESEHFHIWSTQPCKPGQCRMEPAPVQPSSTVDGGALAQVIGRHWEVRDISTNLPRGKCGCGAGVANGELDAHVARAVAEWLKEQGR